MIFTATVTAVAPSVGTTTGEVQFQIDGVLMGTPTALNPSGQAAYMTNTLPVDAHTISAIYAGDGSFTSSTSANITQRIR